MRQL